MNGLSRYRRALKYIENLEEKNKKLKNSAEIKKLHKRLKFTGYKLRTLESIRLVCFILVYPTIATALISVIPGFETFSGKIVKFSTVIGSTICLLLIAVTSRLIMLYTIDLQLISNHMISIYIKK